MAKLIRNCAWCVPQHVIEEREDARLTEDMKTDTLCDKAAKVQRQELEAFKARKQQEAQRK